MRFEHRHGRSNAVAMRRSKLRPDSKGDTAMKTLILKCLAIAVLAVAGRQAFAGEETLDIDTRFRAKIAKEKIKMEALERRAQSANGNGSGNGNGAAAPSCGSQSIGNIETDGRIGAAPREVFVFAPNAINLVTASGCK